MKSSGTTRPVSWKWWVCGLLLLASAMNYMDRQTLANAAVRISDQFHLSQEQYGNFEFVFGWAFAAGSLGFGFLADRFSVRRLYPVVLALWSAVGFATGLAQSYGGLLVCRTLLGLFEGGHWPCAVKTTQRLLEARDRAMGNSVLQSGTSIGAILTPLLMRFLLTPDPQSWRVPFQVVGALGAGWVIAWMLLLRGSEVLHPDAQPSAGPGASWWAHVVDLLRLFRDRRMWVLCVIVACINTGWQTLRAWLPKVLQQGRGYTEVQTLDFTALFYLATDAGCLGAGALTLWLVRRGMAVDASRTVVFLGCALCAALAAVAAVLPAGWMLLATLLWVGAGALGVFPIYHAFTQDVSPRHQGKVTGITGVAAWVTSPAQMLFGRLVDRTGSFDVGLAAAGLLPLAAFLVLWLFWPKPGNAR